KQQLKSNPNNAKAKSMLNELERVAKELNTAAGRYMQPMLNAQLSYLASMIDRADQRPGKDAFDRYDELKNKFEELESSWKKMDNSSSRR
ncbi:MAG: hypothetical protein AAFO07_23605, partial [Bacteroidota bacterium]